jgi:hypothetical protein
MTTVFSSVIEEVKKLSVEEKEELRFLLDRYLIEERRSEIHQDYKASQKEFQEKVEKQTRTGRLILGKSSNLHRQSIQ